MNWFFKELGYLWKPEELYDLVFKEIGYLWKTEELYELVCGNLRNCELVFNLGLYKKA